VHAESSLPVGLKPPGFNPPLSLSRERQFQGLLSNPNLRRYDAGCQGKGIALAQTAEGAMKALEDIGGEDVGRCTLTPPDP
jgi:hypothetical protein